MCLGGEPEPVVIARCFKGCMIRWTGIFDSERVRSQQAPHLCTRRPFRRFDPTVHCELFNGREFSDNSCGNQSRRSGSRKTSFPTMGCGSQKIQNISRKESSRRGFDVCCFLGSQSFAALFRRSFGPHVSRLAPRRANSGQGCP